MNTARQQFDDSTTCPEHIVHIDGVTGSSPVATTKIPENTESGSSPVATTREPNRKVRLVLHSNKRNTENRPCVFLKENAAAMPLISSILANVSCIIQAFASQFILIDLHAC